MPRYLVYIGITLSFLLLTVVYAAPIGETIFISQEMLEVDNTITINNDSALLAISKDSLANASRVSFNAMKINKIALGDLVSPIYTWQVLDTNLVKPLAITLSVPETDDAVQYLVKRENTSQDWQFLEVNKVDNKFVFSVMSEYGQVAIIGSEALPVSIELDQVTVQKGFPVNTPDDLFNFHIIADAVLEPIQVDIDPIMNGIYPIPSDLSLVSPVYHFKISGSEDLKILKDLAIDIKYQSSINTKSIYYWNNILNIWEKSPSFIQSNSKIRTFTHQRELIVAVFADQIMSEGVASWYKYKHGDFAASPDYPKGSKLKVTNIENNKSVVVTINDYGPDRSIHPERVIDLDYIAFDKIGSPGLGLINVIVEKIHE